jgi:hypothetical protein
MMRCAKMARPGPRTIKRPQYNLAGAFLNGGWQRIGFALFAIGDDFLGILLQYPSQSPQVILFMSSLI